MRRRAVLGSAVAGVASFAGCGIGRSVRSLSATGSYPQPYYDAANTNHNPTTGPRQSPVVHWTVEMPPLSPQQPLVADGRVHVSGHAYDQSDGAELWSTDVALRYDPVTVSDGTVYLAAERDGDDGRLYGLDADTGSVNWQTTPSEALVERHPTVVDGSVYVPVKLGPADEAPVRVAAFDAGSGRHRWTAPVGGDVSVGVAAAAETVFVADGRDEACYALSTDDGSVRWRAEGRAFVGPVVVDGGTVYARSWRPDAVHALRTADGARRWVRQFERVSPVSVAGDTLYATVGGADGDRSDSPDSRLVALDAGTGATRWRRPVSGLSAPVSTDGTVYVGDRAARRTGRIAAYDASSGERLWTFSRSKSYDGDVRPEPPVPVSSPVVVEGAAFAVIGDTVYALGE